MLATLILVSQIYAFLPVDSFGPLRAGDFNFEGIVSLSSCSGSLVRFDHNRDDDLAMILTNGHCIGRFPAPSTYISNRPSSRRFTLFDSSGRRAGQVRAKELTYATMTGTDFAIYTLTKSFSEIKRSYGIDALLLARERANINDAIEVISGLWRRGYRCQIEHFAYQLKEGEWWFRESIRYSRPGCNVVGGTSGSPILLANTRTVVGVNNSGNQFGGQCTENNPCEIDENGKITAVRGYGYGQQTHWIYSCLDGIELDLQREGCQLFH